MGIFIYEEVSKSVTKAEWEKVYEETLVLVEAFPLAERGTISYSGKEVICAVHSKEREMNFGGCKMLGWCTDMDYVTLNRAEEYYLPRDLIYDEKVNAEAGDAMMGALSSYMDIDCDSEEKYNQTYSLWGFKTQGEPYHMYLLAIACLIEDRLGEKAFVYGDITLGQCRKAVEMANLYLKKPICIPARCDMERLYKRIQKLPLEELKKLKLFKLFYLGIKDGSFYDFERENFHETVLQEYWKSKFSNSRIETRGFTENLKNYLLYLKEKNTEDCLDIDPESEQPYSIWTLFADFVFGSAHNPKVDRYIPIEDIRLALKKGIGTKCDVDKYIDQYLEKEAAAPEIDVSKENLSTEEFTKMTDTDVSEVFRQIVDKNVCKIQSDHDKYEISDYADLMGYKKGNTIEPRLMESI